MYRNLFTVCLINVFNCTIFDWLCHCDQSCESQIYACIATDCEGASMSAPDVHHYHTDCDMLWGHCSHQATDCVLEH